MKTMGRRENLEYIREQPRGAEFYCPTLARTGLTRREAVALVRDGYQVIPAAAVTLVTGTLPDA